MTKNDILALFKRFGAEITADDVWQVQSATVIKHKALERLAAAAKIAFEPPVLVRAERDEAVILVTGELDGRKEWSIGEALINANYRISGKMAPYPYAMAEKRAKDRVILKLAGLHGIYSEDEADEFKERQAQREPEPPPAAPPPTEAERLIAMVKKATTATELQDWLSREPIRRIIEGLSDEDTMRFNSAKATQEMNLGA